jgi:hypothetical protein
MNKKNFSLALFFLMFLVSETLYSQSFDINGGILIGYGQIAYKKSSEEGDSINKNGVIPIDLGLQVGVTWERIALLAEGNLAIGIILETNGEWFAPWNAGAIFEFYPFIFENGESKLGIGVGGGYGYFYGSAPYVRAEIPFIISSMKIGLNGEYYFLDNGPIFRAGLMVYFRGIDAVNEFFQNQNIIK